MAFSTTSTKATANSRQSDVKYPTVAVTPASSQTCKRYALM